MAPTRLIEIETHFQHLLDLLKLPASNSFKLNTIFNFLKILLNEEDISKYNSYFSDLSYYINHLIESKDFEGLSLDSLNEFQILILKLNSLNIFPNEEILIDILEEAKKGVFKKFDRRLLDNAIPVVLIEKPLDDHSGKTPEIAIIRKLNLISSGRERKDAFDKIEFTNYIDLKEPEIINNLQSIVELAKNKYQSISNKSNFYNFTFFFDKREYIYSGNSHGLAALCLAYNSILINEFEKQYYKFWNDCVFTGEIDENGDVVKIDDKYFLIKLRAVFFSGYEKFVIPEENYFSAKDELEKLSLKYPDRKLKLIPVKNFQDVFSNLEIVERFDLKFIQKLRAEYKRYSTIINSVLSIIFIILIIFITFDFIVPRLDRNPTFHSYIDNHYSIFNEKGIELWHSRDLPLFNKIQYFENVTNQIRCFLTDVNNDGNNELIYIFRGETDTSESRTIYCSNEQIKAFPCLLPLRKLNYPNDPIRNYYYYLGGISLLDCNDDNRNDILFWGVNTQFYPGIIGAIDFNGNLIAEYWNEGMPRIIKIFDINNDGKKEIYCGTCNNRDSLECAALIVFDPEYISGSSPYTDPLGSGIKGTEKYYILFPKTILFDLSGRERNDIQNIQLNSDYSISCWAFENYTNNNWESVMYEFDKDMNIININCNDEFKNKYNNLKETAFKQLPDLTIYLNNLKYKIRWWDGDKFVNHTSINKNYLKVKPSK